MIVFGILSGILCLIWLYVISARSARAINDTMKED